MSGVQDKEEYKYVERPLPANVADAFKAGHGLIYESTLAEKCMESD